MHILIGIIENLNSALCDVKAVFVAVCAADLDLQIDAICVKGGEC